MSLECLLIFLNNWTLKINNNNKQNEITAKEEKIKRKKILKKV